MKRYTKEFGDAFKIIKSANNILIFGHIEPDPDALSSAYALYLYLNQIGKTAKIGLLNEIIADFNFLIENLDESVVYPNDNFLEEIDTIISLDIGSRSRSGEYEKYILSNKTKVINFDHHPDNEKFGDVFVIDTQYSSTAEIVYDFFFVNNIEITPKIAETLYAGIVSDTGGFRYELTTPQTHIVASHLLSFGIVSDAIFSKLFDNLTIKSLQIQAKVANTIKSLYDGKMIVAYMKNEFLEDCSASYEDSIGLIKTLTSIKGSDFCVLLKEYGENEIRANLRSKSDFDVKKCANFFGGGGHKKASGFNYDGNIDNSFEYILKTLSDMYKQFLDNQFF